MKRQFHNMDLAEKSLVREKELQLINVIPESEGRALCEKLGLHFEGLKEDLNEVLA